MKRLLSRLQFLFSRLHKRPHKHLCRIGDEEFTLQAHTLTERETREARKRAARTPLETLVQ